MTPNVTPLVRKLSAQHGVDLDKVTGTGVGGRITKGDIRAAAGLPRESPQPRRAPVRAAAAAAPVIAGKVEEMRSAFAFHMTVKVNPWVLNPLLDDARQSVPWAVSAAEKEGPAPTMFPTGDLPLFVAAGADPKLLLNLPMQARLAAVNADAQTFARMMSTYADSDNGFVLALMELGESDAMHDYRQRMNSWLSGGKARAALDSAAQWANGTGGS